MPITLTPEQLASYHKQFVAIDLNKDGIISPREFATVSKVLGYKLEKDEIMHIFGHIDMDSSGGINFDEFVIAMEDRKTKTSTISLLRAKFRVYDKKNHGQLTAEDLYAVLQHEIGYDLNKCEEMLMRYDKNNDYKLSLLEFVDFQHKVDEIRSKLELKFKDYDQNGDGFIDLHELSQKLKAEGISEERAGDILKKYDTDKDGRLNIREFAVYCNLPFM